MWVEVQLYPSMTAALEEGESKTVLLQAWNYPESSTNLRFTEFMTRAQDGGKILCLTHRPFLPPRILLVLISVRGCVDPRAIMQPEGFYVKIIFQ